MDMLVTEAICNQIDILKADMLENKNNDSVSAVDYELINTLQSQFNQIIEK